jgi:hypothetical protein
MLLRNDVFTELKMEVIGYQFPAFEKEPYDADWLNIKIQVKHPKGNWKAIDPCLLTFEIKQLIEWFEKICEEKGVEKHLYFTEPCLEFEILKDKLRVFFSHKFAPPWIKDYTEEFFIDFTVSQPELKRAAQNLQRELERFPIRVG